MNALRESQIRPDLASELAEFAKLPGIVKELRLEVDALKAEIERSRAASSEELLNVHAAAKVLGMSPAALRQAVYRRSIPALRLGRRLRFRREELLAHAR